MGELAEKLKKLKKAHNTLVGVVERIEKTIEKTEERINKMEVLTERHDKKTKEISELKGDFEELMDRVKKASSFVKKQAEEAVFVEVHNQPIKVIEETIEKIARERFDKLSKQGIAYKTEAIPLRKFKISTLEEKNKEGYRCVGLFGPPIFNEEYIILEKIVVKTQKKIRRTPA